MPLDPNLIAPDTRPAFSEEHITWLFDQFNSLTPRQKDVLQLRYFEGLSSREISERLNIDPSTVSEHLTRSLESLKRRARRDGLMSWLIPWDWRRIWSRATPLRFVGLIIVSGSLGVAAINLQETWMSNPDIPPAFHEPIALKSPTTPTPAPQPVANDNSPIIPTLPIPPELVIAPDPAPNVIPATELTPDEIIQMIRKRWDFSQPSQSIAYREGTIVINHNGEVQAGVQTLLSELVESLPEGRRGEAYSERQRLLDLVNQVHTLALGETPIKTLCRSIEDALQRKIDFIGVSWPDESLNVLAGVTYRELLEGVLDRLRQSRPETELNFTRNILFSWRRPKNDHELLMHYDVTMFADPDELLESARPEDIIELIQSTILIDAAPELLRIQGDWLFVKTSLENQRQIGDLIAFMNMSESDRFQHSRFVESLDKPIPLAILGGLGREPDLHDLGMFLKNHLKLTLVARHLDTTRTITLPEGELTPRQLADLVAKLHPRGDWQLMDKHIVLEADDLDIEIAYPLGRLLRLR